MSDLCTCDAYDAPHPRYRSDCRGHNLADCPDLVRTTDPYGTGDQWYVYIEHGCKAQPSRTP
jgi:hypothetical protein